MKWYDKIAYVYDFFTAGFYKKARIRLIESLEIKKGDRVLMIACGTGQSLKYIQEKTGDTGEIIAVDYSAEMLKIARKRIEKNKWKNIILVNADVRDLNENFLQQNGIKSGFDIMIAELAFSVIPDWQKVMKNISCLLNKNAKIGLLDWYRKKNDLLTKIINYLAEAETTRNTLGFAGEIFSEIKVVERLFFKNVYVATGKKYI